MDDQVAVGVCHTLTDTQKKTKLISQRHPLGLNINGNAIHILHDEIWPAIAGVPRIDEACNRRMVERSQELPFLQKTVAPCRPVDVGAQDLDGHLLLNLAIRT